MNLTLGKDIGIVMAKGVLIGLLCAITVLPSLILVCDKLIEQGYNVETQYGVGGYRIDLVIKSKDGKDNILGIECDGKLYHSSKYARERDYHRQKYLESRGWKIYRIWSTNWWKNPTLEIKKIVKYI